MLIDYLNENSFQTFPLTEGSNNVGGLTYSRAWLLDLGITFGITSGHDGVMPVVLSKIVSNGTNVTFWFSCAAVGLVFQFTCAAAAPSGYTVQAVVTGSSGTPTLGAEHGFGFLQVGNLASFVSVTNTWTGGVGVVDPSCVMSLYDHQVHTINVANAPTTVLVDSTCATSSELAESYSTTELVVADISLTGAVNFTGGYYSTINSDALSSTITVNVTTDPEQGDLLPCNVDDVLVYPVGYTLPNVPSCSELIFTVNGIGPNSSGVFSFHDSPGITFTAAEEANSLLMTINQNLLFKGLDVVNECTSSSSVAASSSSSLVPPNDVAGLVMWIDASAITGSDGSTITKLTDISGWDNHLLSTTGTITLAASSPIHSKHAAHFSGSAMASTLTAVDGFSEAHSVGATVFLVMASHSEGGQTVFSGTGDSADLLNRFLMQAPDGTGHIVWNYGNYSPHGNLSASMGFSADTPVILTVVARVSGTGGPLMEIWKNGTLLASATLASSTAVNWSGKQLLFGGEDAAHDLWTGWLGELCVYSRACTHTEITNIVTALQSKWAF